MKSRIFLLIALVAMVSCQSKDPVERRIDKLLSQMTLEEKIAQMTQVCGGQISYNIADQIRNGAGSMLNSVGAEADYYQHIAVEESRLGIPMIFARDVIHGFRTIFPIPLGQAATFDPDIVEEGARIAAEEAVQAGLRWTFSPMVDVARDPRWGRVAEGYGEDTYLASVMGAAAVRGYQGNDSVVRMAACVKHFAGYAVSEGGRDYNSTWIPEIQLRETYLPPFKAAIDAGSLSIMCAFNDLNGVPASGNKHLNVDILRDEWHFDGVLVSDWASLQNMNNQGNSANLKEATKLCANAQMDMDMESKGYPRHLKELVEEGEVSEDIIDNCVRNILRMKFRLGLFDNPYCYTKNPEYFTPESLSAAQKAAEESAVLLKNNNILPLASSPNSLIASKPTVLVCGPMANAPHEQNGTWCFDKDDAMTITPMMAFRELAKEGKIKLIEQKGEHWSREFNKENIATLARLAKQVDVVLYFGGEESILSGEARSRAVLNLPGDQSEQIRAIKATGKPVVLTVMAGRPLCIKEDIDRVDAVLYAFHGGTMQGPALANLIMGKVAPSGRLPMTFPMGEGQIPFYYNYKMPSRLMDKSPKLINDIPVRAYQFSIGETSYWLEYGNKPLYPFGYGLTYTTFEYGAIQLSDTILSISGKPQSIIASCEITNTGHCDAVAVPQLYIRDVVGTLTRPLRELKGFQRVNIPAGETRTVTFEISEQDLAYWHLAEGVSLGSEGEYTFSAEKGDFHVWIAPNAAEGQYIPFTLVE